MNSASRSPHVGDVERGDATSQKRTYRTRYVRDVTYKIVPFCIFVLVLFSAGAIIVSTTTFRQPIPYQATVVVSIVLLVLFVLFAAGGIYLYREKHYPPLTEGPNCPDRPEPAEPALNLGQQLDKMKQSVAAAGNEMSQRLSILARRTVHRRPGGADEGVDIINGPELEQGRQDEKQQKQGKQGRKGRGFRQWYGTGQPGPPPRGEQEREIGQESSHLEPRQDTGDRQRSLHTPPNDQPVPHRGQESKYEPSRFARPRSAVIARKQVNQHGQRRSPIPSTAAEGFSQGRQNADMGMKPTPLRVHRQQPTYPPPSAARGRYYRPTPDEDRLDDQMMSPEEYSNAVDRDEAVVPSDPAARPTTHQQDMSQRYLSPDRYQQARPPHRAQFPVPPPPQVRREAGTYAPERGPSQNDESSVLGRVASMGSNMWSLAQKSVKALPVRVSSISGKAWVLTTIPPYPAKNKRKKRRKGERKASVDTEILSDIELPELPRAVIRSEICRDWVPHSLHSDHDCCLCRYLEPIQPTSPLGLDMI